jgi:Carbohydrate binding domain
MSARKRACAAAFWLCVAGCGEGLQQHPGACPNLLPNPGLEANLDGWTVFYDSGVGVSGATTPAHGGRVSLAITPAGGKTYIGANALGVPLAKGQQYTGSWWVWVATAGTYTAQITRADSAFYGSTTTIMVAADNWTQLSSTFTVTDWAFEPVLAFRLEKAAAATFATSEIVYYDDLAVTRSDCSR